MSAARVLRHDTLGTPEERQLARKLADSILRRLPKSVPREDIHQAALIGLWDALRKSTGDVTPEQRKGYLITRIRGQIFDELRAQDWLPRRMRRELGPEAPLAVIVRFDDLVRDGEGPWLERHADPSPSPEEHLVTECEADEALGAPLTVRHRHVVRGYYWKGRRFGDLAGELGTSEPRVSQIHAQALSTMRAWCTGEIPERAAHWDNSGHTIRRDARLIIERKHQEHDHRATDRRAGDAAGAPARPGPFPVAVPKRWLGGAPAPAARRSVPRGARGAELGRKAPAGLCAARPAPVAAGAAAGTSGGLPVSAAAPLAAAPEAEAESDPDPVPSVLPEEGVVLPAELSRYRDWLVQQALVRSNGNRSQAARLLGINRTTLVMLLGKPATRVRLPAKRSKPEAPASPDPRLDALAARIPWDDVASWRVHGLSDARIAQKLAGRMMVNKWTIEKALSRPRPLAKCGP